MRTRLIVILAATLSLVASACSSGAAGGPASPSGGHVVEVIGAENFWGSIASQIGDVHAHVTSIITNPNADPHSYEPTASDARAVAGAQVVIENGIGYDPWMPRLVAASGSHPLVLDAGRLLRQPSAGNPHVWYNAEFVTAMAAAIESDLALADPADSQYFAQGLDRFDNVDLAPYHQLISEIRVKYRGTPVGASESIFSWMAPVLALDLITPYRFLKAISEGSDVSAADKVTIDNQIRSHEIRIYVYNSQNATPDVQAQLAECRAAGIPTATITETLTPATATFQAWQVSELQGILAALQRSGA